MRFDALLTYNNSLYRSSKPYQTWSYMIKLSTFDRGLSCPRFNFLVLWISSLSCLNGVICTPLGKTHQAHRFWIKTRSEPDTIEGYSPSLFCRRSHRIFLKPLIAEFSSRMWTFRHCGHSHCLSETWIPWFSIQRQWLQVRVVPLWPCYNLLDT